MKKKIILGTSIIGLLILITIIYMMIFKSSYRGIVKDFWSEWSGGLNRKVYVYNYGSNEPIREYNGILNIYNEKSSSEVEFIIDNKRIIVHGGLTIIEEQ